jgi:predicted nucleotide-binding protein (sugar kinase/HSP70/actin superfamily)
MLTQAPVAPPGHYRRPAERPFVAAERSTTTILFGGLTVRHEALIQAGLEGSGYLCEHLPQPDFEALQLGREYGNSGQCNPAYFTIGSLLKYLKALEARGLTRRQIIDRYVYFTAGSCGPCRFGTYESEFRLALQNAGFDGFRVLLFQQDHGLKQASGGAGLQYSVDFGLRMLLALQLGDVLNDLARQIRPYEVRAGETDRVLAECVAILADRLRQPAESDPMARAPRPLRPVLAHRPRLAAVLRRLFTWRERLHSAWIDEPMEECRRRIQAIEVDRTRVRPLVKITGEFWAQTTEGDGNYRMFDALEREGAEVLIEPAGSWVTYLTSHARYALRRRFHLERYDRRLRLPLRSRWAAWRGHWVRVLLLQLGEWLYLLYYRRVDRRFGGIAHRIPSQRVVARLAAPFYNPLARGGEGHLEVGKTIYYSTNGFCHMVLSLKPFGCMPSAQSDGVQAGVIGRFPQTLFVPVETSGDAEVNALSRVQMALCDARLKARDEFARALAMAGSSLGEIRAYAAAHPELSGALYRVPHRHGIAGTAASFVLHLGDCMAQEQEGRDAWALA